eukprot:COSAG02_NODE_2598_length_8449_cov_59.030042_6_plen_68_part_00
MRLEALQDARLLANEELESLENEVVDCIDVLLAAFATEQGVDKMTKMMIVDRAEGGKRQDACSVATA